MTTNPYEVFDGWRGSEDKPIVVAQSTDYGMLVNLHHVHDTRGVCLKNRFDYRRSPPPGLSPEEATLKFLRETLEVNLLPWQEGVIRAAITGELHFEVPVR